MSAAAGVEWFGPQELRELLAAVGEHLGAARWESRYESGAVTLYGQAWLSPRDYERLSASEIRRALYDKAERVLATVETCGWPPVAQPHVEVLPLPVDAPMWGASRPGLRMTFYLASRRTVNPPDEGSERTR
ncbi:hypothetical protein [Streptosporangium sp. NPDC002524]|uniref:hypothetical protein n=1 Tax=Streptosporangium sp. NPDC002524 TaxID=3154537 RepID=UPI00332D54DD